MAPGRADVAVVAAVTLLTTGAALGEPSLFLAAAVPLVYLGVGAVSRPPSPSSIEIERAVDPDVPAPGQRATVTLTVRNAGDRTLPDVRVVDRLPDRVPVVAGSPRGCLSLRPGESGRLSYVVVATQGDHEFDAPLARLRALPATEAATAAVPAEGTTVLRCRRGVTDVPQARGSLRRVGTQPTDSGGAGIEFHSVREYRAGDDVSRVDWRRLAKTGELSTVEFRETRATKTAIVVDGRRAARWARADGHPTGAELSAYAADRTFERLAAAGNHVGLLALGIDRSAVEATVPADRGGRPWVPPGADAATRTRIGAVLDAVVAADGRGSEKNRNATESATASPDPGPKQSRPRASADGGTAAATALRERLPRTAAVVIATPLLDDAPLEIAMELLAAGREVTVVSPDVTVGETPGAAAARIERRLRIQRLRGSEATVVDWHTDRSLAAAMEGAT